MPRAYRTFLPGLVWHLTHRCHKQDYLLKFVRDRRRYRAWLFESDVHLQRCLVYIDLNMVHAGVVQHPSEWESSGYREIQSPPQRYAIIDLAELSSLCGFKDVERFQEAHRQWVADALPDRQGCRLTLKLQCVSVVRPP